MILLFITQMAGLGAFSSSLTDKIKDNDFTLRHTELIVRGNISGQAGRQRFLDGSSEIIEGECNIKNGTLPKNEAFIFNEIAVNYGTAATAIEPGAVSYDKKAIEGLRNSTFYIEQNGRRVLKIPVKTLHNPYTVSNKQDEYTQLLNLAYLADDIAMEWGFEYPKAGGIPAGADQANGHHYAEVYLRGLSTVDRPKA